MTRERFRLHSPIDLRARIWLVMLLVLLPALAFIVASSLLERARARAQAQADLLALARLAANGQKQSLAEMQRTLALVAALAPVQAAAQGGDPSACAVRLAELAALYPQSLGFGVWNLNGQALCANQGLPAPASAAGQLWFRQALDRRAFSVGDFQIGDPRGEPTIAFGYPITGANGQLLAVVSSGLDLAHLTGTASTLPLPPDTLVTLFDHNGTVLARSLDAAAWVGKPLPDSAGLAADLAQGADVMERAGDDGVPRLYAFTPVAGPGGNLVYLSLGRPLPAVYGPSDTALAVSLAITGSLSVLALALAGWWSHQTLVRPMLGLLGAADRLARGDLNARARPEPAGSEVDRLAVAFNAMAASLQQREADLLKAREDAQQATRQAQLGQARAAQLEAVTAGLSRAITPAEIMHVILHQGAGAVGAIAATLLMLSDDPAQPDRGAWLKQAASVGYPDQIGRLFQQYPVSSPLPAADVVRTGEAVWIESAAAYRARYPQLTEVINSTDYEAAVAVPLRYAGRLIGVLALSFPGVLAFTSETRNYILTLASFCAHALERARLFDETQRLNSALEQLRGLAHRLYSTQEEERRSLARELQDELGVTLAGLKMSVAKIQGSALAPGEAMTAELAALSAAIDDAAQWARRIASELGPGVLDDRGLPAAIEWLARDFEARSGIACSLVLEVKEVVLEPERATAVFRVVQESLANIARHAHATSVRIRLEEQQGRLAVRVEDNGQGFDASAWLERSLGLVGMRERVNGAAGELIIQSAPGQGTTITVKIPLARKA